MKLSICMPTYNFGPFIAATLDSIMPQLTPHVEVVILDGGSTDDTQAVVAEYASRDPAIRYIRQDYRGGIDRDMSRSIELAHGEYCWLFSSDDIMQPGALDCILREIQSGHDIYLAGFTLCDKQMQVIGEHPVLDAEHGATFGLGDPLRRKRYFARAKTTTALFSFMGSIVMRREKFLSRPLADAYVGSLWAHVERIFRLALDGLTVKYVGISLLLKRGENDSFMDRGLVHRYAVAIDGYPRIANDVFGDDSEEARHTRRVIVNEFPAKFFLFARAKCARDGRLEDLKELDRLARTAYRDRTLRNIVHLSTYRFVPLWAYEMGRAVYKSCRRALQG